MLDVWPRSLLEVGGAPGPRNDTFFGASDWS